MTEEQEEAFNHIAYSYRSWPGTDPQGVVDRYKELLEYVENLMDDAALNEREAIEIYQMEHYD